MHLKFVLAAISCSIIVVTFISVIIRIPRCRFWDTFRHYNLPDRRKKTNWIRVPSFPFEIRKPKNQFSPI